MNILDEGLRIIGSRTPEFTLADYPTVDEPNNNVTLKSIMNKVGEIIEINPILQKHLGEIGCYTCAKICEYLGCHKGEVYVAFDDINNIQQGTLCKIKEDVCLNRTLAAFDKRDDSKDRQGSYWINIGYNGNAIVYLDQYKYIMRLN